MNKRSIAALASGALMLTGVLAGNAFGHHDNEDTARTSIDMIYKSAKGKFVGTVDSGRERCLGGRTVGLFKARNDDRVATAHTNDSGGWSIAVRKNTGRYYSKVSAETYVLDSELDEYGELLWEHLLTCTGGKSDVKGT